MPDWKNETDYDFTKDLDQNGWTWEFLRRNAEYREDFKASLLPTHFYSPLKNEAESDRQWTSRALAEGNIPKKLAARVYYARKWRIRAAPCNPNGAATPLFELPHDVIPSWESLSSYFEETHGGTQELRAGFGILLFDLTKPLSQQFQEGKPFLEKMQEAISPEPRTNTTAKHRLYLQLLDAVEHGASNEDIRLGIAHYSKLPLVKDGKSIAKDRISDHKKSAIWLRDNPLSLIGCSKLSPQNISK